jgi:cytochrome oxidase Cu insertion factor (SCO1/SenC/PrrC family)
MTQPSIQSGAVVRLRMRAARRASGLRSLAPALLLAASVVAPVAPTTRLLAGDIPLDLKYGADWPATDLDRVKPGERAPDFTLEDQDGRAITLSSFQAHAPVVLVFYRGHW